MVYPFVDPSEENESSRHSECLPSVQPEVRSLWVQQAMILVYKFIREGLMNAVNQMQSNHRKVFVGSFFKLWAQESGVEPPDLIQDDCEDWAVRSRDADNVVTFTSLFVRMIRSPGMQEIMLESRYRIHSTICRYLLQKKTTN